MPKIAPLTQVDPNADIADDVEIGPFCVVGPEVTIGAGCVLHSHVCIIGKTTIGENNHFHQNTVIGGWPQDKKFRGSHTRLEIGDHNQFRESVTIHVGTDKGGGVTRVGSHNLLMVNTHIGHDAQFGSHNVLANNCMVAGHVVCGDNVNMMGGVGIHHFVTIGDYAYLGGAARIHHDVPPFVKIDGADQIRGINSVGLRRAGFSVQDIEELEDACRRLFYRRKTVSSAIAELETQTEVNCYVRQIVEFLQRRNQGKHGRYLEATRTA